MAAASPSSSPPPPPAPGAAFPAEERRGGGGGGGRPPVPPYVKAAAGSLGGVMEACCLQPIDVVKTRLQLDRSGAYRGIAHCGTTVARAEGVRALWKGLTPFATHLTLKYALRLGSNAVLQSAFKDPTTGKVSAHGRLASGFGAGVIEALLIVTPFEARSCFSLPQTVLLQSSYLGCVGHAYSLYGSHKNRLPHRQKSIIL